MSTRLGRGFWLGHMVATLIVLLAHAPPLEAATEPMARRLSDCVNELTPAQVDAFMRSGRRLADCASLKNVFTEGLPDQHKTQLESVREGVRDAYNTQLQQRWERQKNPTPEETQAQVTADASRAKLRETTGVAYAAEKKFKDVMAANSAAASAAMTTKTQVSEDLTAKQDALAAAMKLKGDATELQRKQAEYDLAKKTYDDFMVQFTKDELARTEAEANARAAMEQADAERLKAKLKVPFEVRAKKDDEEACPPSPVGSAPNCEHGGRCFQVTGKPETRRCSCGDGYRGDKCQFKPCSPPTKEGNMVNGRCVAWDEKYVCPRCDKTWELQLACRDVGTQRIVRKQLCAGMWPPQNELYDRTCRICQADKE